MKRKNFSEAQIVSILQMQESGRSVKEICREHGISDGAFYNWKAKYGGMEVSDVGRLNDLQEFILLFLSLISNFQFKPYKVRLKGLFTFRGKREKA